MKKRNRLILLLLIVLISAFARMYRLDRPLADWHSWRQADTAAVTRRFVQTGINLLQPTYDDLSNIPSGLDNPNGYRMVEFPFMNAFIAQLYMWTDPIHELPVHVFSRLISILFSLCSIVVLYKIVAQLVDEKTGLLTAAVFGLLPYNIFYHTTALPEIPLVFFSLSAIFLWIRYSASLQHGYLIGFTVTAAFALLLKPLLVFLVPALLYIYLKNNGFKGLTNWQIYLVALIVVIPLLLWRRWIAQFPEGIPAMEWLYNSTNIRFKGAFFRWLFADRIGNMILGYWGLIPFGLGLILQPFRKAGWFFHLWLLGVIAYFVVFATGNVTHDYYQIFTIPVIAIFVGIGLRFLTNSHLGFNRFAMITLLLITVGFTFAFGWFRVRDLFNINNPAMVLAGERANSLLPHDAKVIAPYGGDTAFLYQINRQGWPIGGEITDKIEQGASFYVSTSQDDEANLLIDSCRLIEKQSEYLIIDLRSCNLEALSL